MKPKPTLLQNLGLKNATLHYQLYSDELHQKTLEKNQGKESSSGALAIQTGTFRGRSPEDRFIVQDNITKDKV